MAVLNKRAIVMAIEMYGVTAIRLGRTLNPALDVLIKALFANNEQGFAYDPNDLTTLYQDVAGTIPVTAAGQPVGLMLDKSKGLALGQELVTNGDFSNGTTGWISNPGATISNTNQELIVTTTAISGALGLLFSTVVGRRYKLTAKVVSTNVPAGIRIFETSTTTIYETDYIATGRVISASFVATTTTTQVYLRSAGAGIAVWDNISVKELPGNHAYQTVSASRPTLQRNATTGAYYLAFDGVDDFLQTNSIDFTATDKVSLFAGVRKLSDATVAYLIKFGTGVTAGRFELLMPPAINSPRYELGTDSSWAHFNMGAAPISGVIVGFINRAATSSANGEILSRYNGVSNSLLINSGTNATGNLGNLPLYIGRRDGTAYPFTGNLYSLIIVGRLTTDSETIALEKSIAKNTGVTLNV